VCACAYVCVRVCLRTSGTALRTTASACIHAYCVRAKHERLFWFQIAMCFECVIRSFRVSKNASITDILVRSTTSKRHAAASAAMVLCSWGKLRYVTVCQMAAACLKSCVQEQHGNPGFLGCAVICTRLCLEHTRLHLNDCTHACRLACSSFFLEE